MTIEKIKQSLAKLPEIPGVYLFKNANGAPLYIGKAANLRRRVPAYLKTDNPRLEKMVQTSVKLDFIRTGSAIQALILESQLIKKHKPPFNIMLRDDKQYGYVGFGHEDFPKIFVTHQPTKIQRLKIKNQNNNSKFKNKLKAISYKLEADYIGPFTDIGALKTTLKLLRRIFPYCTCTQKHHVKCLNAHLELCLGFCCLKNYRLQTTPASSRLSRGRADYRLYSRNIRAIREILSGKQTTLLKQLEKEMKMLAARGELERAIELRGKIARVKRVFENASLLAKSYKLEARSSGTKAPNILKELKRVLHLKVPPKRIEGYDVANIGGKHATGSMVVFTDGVPDKNEYRKFNIKTVHQSDDTAMLREVLTRRLNHPEWPYPDLIVVDGGKPQLNAMRSVLTTDYELQTTDLPVLALTKDDHHRGHEIVHKVGKVYKVIKLRTLSDPVRNLILSVDSEAHRFAIAHYRQRHRKVLITG